MAVIRIVDEQELTTHDFFAGMALAAWLPIASDLSKTGEVEPDEVMKLCYDTADAMMRERTRRRSVTIGFKEAPDGSITGM